MPKKINQIIGKNAGSVSIILAGIHGNEKCGVQALRSVMLNREIENGRIFFGCGNPLAIKTNKRFVESDLNRIFKNDQQLSVKERTSYEYQRAQFLKKYLKQADVLLDIHASTIPTPKPFVICERNAKKIVPYLPIDLVVFGFDKIEPGGTDYYMNNIGKIGICLEAGYLSDPQSIKLAEESIVAFLKTQKHINGKVVSRRQAYIQMYKKYYARTNSFTLTKSFNNFDIVEKGQVIGIDGQIKIKANKKSLILFAHNCQRIGAEAFLLGERKKALSG